MLQHIHDTALKLARDAAVVLRQACTADFDIELKDSVDPVTTADKQSEALIVAGIREAYPTHTILAEESGLHEPATSVYRWVIDPLDGTVNFSHRQPHFAVLIAVQERTHNGFQTIIGITIDPLRGEEFVAVRGAGAYFNGQRIQVSQTNTLIGSLGATGFPYDRLLVPPDNHAEFCRMNLLTQGIRRFGSAGLDLAYIACGRFDFFWEYRLKPWDYLAGALLVEEAGGIVSSLHQHSIEEGTLLACNPALHTVARAAIESASSIDCNSHDNLATYLPKALAQRLTTP